MVWGGLGWFGVFPRSVLQSAKILVIAYFILFYVLQHNNDNLYPAISQILIIPYFYLLYVLEHNNDNNVSCDQPNSDHCLLCPFLCFRAQ